MTTYQAARRVERLQAERAQHAAAVASAATSGAGAAELDDRVRALASIEGQLAVASRLARAIEADLDREEQVAVLFQLLQDGADDSWSGRGNDLRRARFDGVRREVESYYARLEGPAR